MRIRVHDDRGFRRTFHHVEPLVDEPRALFSPEWDARIDKLVTIVVAFIVGWLCGILQSTTWQ